MPQCIWTPPEMKHPLFLAAPYVWMLPMHLDTPLMPQMSPYFQTTPCMSLGVEFSFNFLQWHISLLFGCPLRSNTPLFLAAPYVWMLPMHLDTPLMPQMSPYFQTTPCMSLGVEFSFNFLQWHLSLCLDAP